MKTKISKIFGVILVLIIALSSISMNLVKADIQIMEPYKSYCRRDTAYTWFTRISTTDVANGDDVGVWYTLPWSFPYFGEYKTRVWICSNGFLTFDPTPALTDYSNTPEEFKERYMIAPFWDDLRTDVSGGIVSTPGVYVDYVENCIVITWEATRYGEPADSIKFQVVLAPSGIIRVSKNYITGAGGFTPTYGISKGTTIDFLSLSYAPYYATWDFLYDVDDLFYYDRAGAPILDPPTYYCLTSGGYVYNGECHSGPPVSRDYVPDYFE
ncbi:MAG: hypothetical protein M1490_03380, partial [Candidatus Bathyarchaeota archaeon]|nr:hypothetical protein [Candidatus Bathyarchaeota archaeon]